jgi:hypothetical protein
MGRNFPSFHICLTVLTVKLELSLSLFVEVGEPGLVSARKKPLTVLTVDSPAPCAFAIVDAKEVNLKARLVHQVNQPSSQCLVVNENARG